MNSYSQYGEDIEVAKIFGDSKGLLLEIGAWSATTFSNSRLFIEQGWDAVLVEFSPMPVHSLVKEYGYNPNVKIIQAAITENEQPATEFDITEDALSTADPQLKQRWLDASVNYYGTLWVPTLSIDQLYKQFFSMGKPEYVSVDTEGTSAYLAAKLMKRYHPHVLVAEFDDGTNLLGLKVIASQTGYRIAHENDTNIIFESHA